MVGTSGAAYAMAGFQYSLDYAKNRPQGRLPSCKDPLSPMVNIVEHADVKRMLLAQKSYAEGAMALVLLGSQLSDDEKTAPTPEAREQAHTLLDLLTPVMKTWPSEYGPKANDHAIQILGGHGYIDEHPVELFYRDNRLNPIHEGTTCIQSLDLLARKVPMNKSKGYYALLGEFERTLAQAEGIEAVAQLHTQLAQSIDTLNKTTNSLLTSMATEDIDLVLANSVLYLSLFGHVVIAWLWLKQATVAAKALTEQCHETEQAFYRGKLQAAQYFYRYELPQIKQWSETLIVLDDTTLTMSPDWF